MGVEKEILREGDGKTYPQKNQKLTMHYSGTLAKDGTKFDSSYDRGLPFQFKIGRGEVIEGWDDGGKRIISIFLLNQRLDDALIFYVTALVMKMSLGEKARLNITSDYGYGSEGAGGVIPAHADLVFEVELLKIGDMEANVPAEAGEGGCCVIL